MKGLGKHLLVEFYGVDKDKLDDKDKLEKLLLIAVEESEATYLHHYLHQFSPQGVSGVVVVAESHLALHTWPEYRYMAIDYFTCGDKVDPQAAIDFLQEQLDPELVEVDMKIRGGPYIHVSGG